MSAPDGKSPFRDMPEVPRELVLEHNRDYEPLLFYTTVKGGRYFHCSSCLWQGEITYTEAAAGLVPRASGDAADYNDVYDAMHGAHKQAACCPSCGRSCTLINTGIARKCTTLNAKGRAVFLLPTADPGRVWARAYYTEKNYPVTGYASAPYCSETMRYLFTPEGVTCWKKLWTCGQSTIMGSCDEDFAECKLREPFTGGYNGLYASTYGLYGSLDNTFLRYADVTRYRAGGDYSGMRFLGWYIKRPSVEWMLKQGYRDIVRYCVEKNVIYKHLINWQGRNAPEAFGLTRPECELLKDRKNPIQDLIDYKRERVYGYSFAEWCRLRNIYGDKFVPAAVRFKISAAKLENYFGRQICKETPKPVNVFYRWNDYITMACKLNYDLTQRVVVFPRDLAHAHAVAVELRNAAYAREAKQKARAESRAAKALMRRREKLYTWSDGVHLMRLPSSQEEIIAEGQRLHHCVAGYAVRHFEGKTTILFLRRCDAPDAPLVTIEMREGVLRQAYGHHDTRPEPEELAAIDAWLAEVYRREHKAKPKNKTDTERATA